ncbi:MAG: dipeptidase [Proteobacteria bacterium]|nr:dipeptidase [Pseudomonadota bacterium]
MNSEHRHGPACGCVNEKGEPLYVTAPSEETHKALNYCEKNIESWLSELETLVKIPSVSLEGFNPEELKLSAEATAESLRRAGLEKVELLSFGDVHPYVYAEWVHKKDAPTLLLYAHHDVQPSGRDEKWNSAPFVPTVSQGRLYGRGTADDKAGIIAHVAAIASFLKTSGELPVNVKILIEGEEETGSHHLAEFVRRYKHVLNADAMILTDCANIDSGVPSVTTALRGLVALDVELESLTHPVHSGLWGGILPDPVLALSKLLATLTDDHGRMAVEGIYDDVRGLSASERKGFEALQMENLARRATGLFSELPFVVPENQFAEALWRAPSLSINAIQSGSRKLVSNVIQDGAWARVSIRIVPDMKPEKVLSALEKHLKKHAPAGFRLKTVPQAASHWWSVSDINEPAYQIAARSLEKGYGRSTQFIGCGASIPFVQPLSDELGGIPAILVGVEDPYTNAHSENESLDLQDFRRTLLGQIHMLADFSKYRRK